MRLSREEQSQLNLRFPKDIELSLGNHLSGKVQADLYEVLPVGKPSFLWITYFKNTHAAIIVFKTSHGYKFEPISACFVDKLAYGTILKGTYFTRPKTNEEYYKFFCADDILYYCGKNLDNMSEMNMFNKLSLITRIFENKEIDNIHGINTLLNISMPIFANDYTIAQSYLGALPYPTYGIRFIKFDEKTSFGVQPGMVKTNLEERSVFVVRANIEPDSYTIFAKDYKFHEKRESSNEDLTVFSNHYGNMRKVGLCLIPSYQESIRMNMLFRNIKENISIDAIEESDDEDDFEDIEPTKYLLPDVEYKLYCYFSMKTGRWIPEGIAPENAEISPMPKSKVFLPKAKGKGRSFNGKFNKGNTYNGNSVQQQSQSQSYNTIMHTNTNENERYTTDKGSYGNKKNTYYRNLKVDVNTNKYNTRNCAIDNGLNTNMVPRHNRNIKNYEKYSPFQPFSKSPSPTKSFKGFSPYMHSKMNQNNGVQESGNTPRNNRYSPQFVSRY
jgi:hypothetical protein